MQLRFWKKRPGNSGPDGKPLPKKKKGIVREWLDSILFAAIAALIIRTFLVEAFMIPTGSMERTLLVGDFLFVSKLHYGPRLPMVPLAVPFVHNRMPIIGGKSFLGWPVLPYARIPGFTDVERGDIVVFNYPADDIFPNDQMGSAPGDLGPIDIPSVKENYIKRCVAVAGDVFELREGAVYINNKAVPNPPEAQQKYKLRLKPNSAFDPNWLATEFGYRMPCDERTPNSNCAMGMDSISPFYLIDMTEAIFNTFRQYPNIRSLERIVAEPRVVNRETFIHYPPDTERFPFNLDNWGPVRIPKAGETVQISPGNLSMYARIIDVYEENDLEVRGSQIFINGLPATHYTFKMDYYFMMGDNRYNSLDSRFWGFVPRDHVIGTPMFVLFSRENGIRWNRWFTGVD